MPSGRLYQQAPAECARASFRTITFIDVARHICVSAHLYGHEAITLGIICSRRRGQRRTSNRAGSGRGQGRPRLAATEVARGGRAAQRGWRAGIGIYRPGGGGLNVACRGLRPARRGGGSSSFSRSNDLLLPILSIDAREKQQATKDNLDYYTRGPYMREAAKRSNVEATLDLLSFGGTYLLLLCSGRYTLGLIQYEGRQGPV